ncbi:hypothetical protein V6N11_043833, partial [Hibiscus sabdariffa]
MASSTGLPASQTQILCRRCSPPISSPAFVSSPLHFKKQAPVRRLLVLPLKCSSSGPSQDTETEAETTSTPSSVSLASSNSTYNWRAGIGAVGIVETAYLTYHKLSGSDAFCPLGGGSCGDVLNSDYALIFGVPLPLLGLIAYGFVTTLSLQLSGKNLPLGISSEKSGRLLLLGSTTSMAAASAYFLYILSTKFAGTSCSYCLMSALLSFSLFFISLKDVGLQEVQKVVGLQVCIASLVVATLSTSYSNLRSAPLSAANNDLPYFTTEIRTKSSPFAISLARHLHSIGAKMYGAFWCSHCQEQKQMFGREAAKLLDYVECFPDGYKTGTNMIKACADANLEGFRTRVINGQVLSGDMELEKLAEATVFLQFGNFVAWITEMIFLSWARPSPEQQKSCINKSGTFNYDTKYKGATAKPVSCIKEDKELSKDGYLINHARVLVGSGFETYEKGKTALQNWRHFGLDWAFVDPKTPIRNGEKFCVCLKEFLPWVMMPLQVVYVKENTRAKTKKAAASFGFGSGTLHGHLLAGEERFSIELDENDQV